MSDGPTAEALRTLHNPKSHSFTLYARSTRKFPGLMSRWITGGDRLLGAYTRSLYSAQRKHLLRDALCGVSLSVTETAQVELRSGRV